MAVLSNSERAGIWATLMARFSNLRESVSISKAEFRAAIDGLDDYFDTNASAINTAIPQPARSSLSASQKSLIAAYVLIKRWGGTL